MSKGYEVYDDGTNLWLVSTHSMNYNNIKSKGPLLFQSDTKFGSDGAYTYCTDKGLEPYYKDTTGFFEVYV